MTTRVAEISLLKCLEYTSKRMTHSFHLGDRVTDLSGAL